MQYIPHLPNRTFFSAAFVLPERAKMKIPPQNGSLRRNINLNKKNLVM